MSERQHWMDVFRGAAMLALLLSHASAIPVLYSDAVPEASVVRINSVLAPYRMPALMLLSGMLLSRSLEKPLGDYLWNKTSALAWPFMIWAMIFLVVTGQAALIVAPHIWVPITYLWFILFLYLYYLVAPLLSRFPRGVVPAAAVLAAAPLGDSGFVQKFVIFAAFFFLGFDLSRSPRWLGWLRDRPVQVALLGLAVMGGAARVVAPDYFTHYLASFALGVAGILGLVGALSRSVVRCSPRALCVVGRSSIAYYVSHFPAMILTVGVLAGAGVESAWAYLSANLVVSLGVGYLLARLGGRWPWSLLLRGPDKSVGQRAGLS